MAMAVAKNGAFLRGFCALLLLSLFLMGCTGGHQAASNAAEPAEAPADSLRAKFLLTIHSVDGKSQELDAVLFSVPGKRYRMELTGSLGIGVASLLWLPEGWQMVFPTEKLYMQGAGYMVGLLNDPSLPLVHIHQVAGLFEGRVVPENLEEVSVRDSACVSDSGAVATGGCIVKIREARDALTRHFTYAEKNGEVLWLKMLGRDGKDETLVIEEYKEFSGVKTPSRISFVRDDMVFLEIRVRKIDHGKKFGLGTWRLNIPRSYQRIGG